MLEVRQRVTLDQVFKTFLGLSFLVCELGWCMSQGRSFTVSVELRLTGVMSFLPVWGRGRCEGSGRAQKECCQLALVSGGLGPMNWVTKDA